MAYATDIYKCINIMLDNYEQLEQLRNDTGATPYSYKNYIEFDKDTFQEFDVSIPDIIGKDLYNYTNNLFNNNSINFVRCYYEY